MRPVVTEIELLVPTRLAVDHAWKLGGAPEADVGEEIDDVIHRIGRQQLAMRAAMAALATTVSLRLGLLRAAARTSRASTGAIARRRTVSILRILAQLLRQDLDLGDQTRDLLDQLSIASLLGHQPVLALSQGGFQRRDPRLGVQSTPASWSTNRHIDLRSRSDRGVDPPERLSEAGG